MLIVSGWATAVVTFEATMAGAVLGTLCMMILEAGLLGSRRAPVPDLPDNGVIVQVRCARGAVGLESTLAEIGAARIERVTFPD